MPLELYERASVERFFAPGYILANPDLKEAAVDPNDHFRRYGAAEGRLQFNPDILKPSSPYRRTKFERFREMLVFGLGVPEAAHLPCHFGHQHFELSSYLFESANAEFGPFVNEVEANQSKSYLDLGCGLRKRVHENCLYLEVYPSITADIIVEPTCLYPIATNSLDGIGCFAVLEHTLKPWVVIQEMHRMLKPGGKVFIDWPFLQPVHGFPSHYFNATRMGLSSLFGVGFEIDFCATLPHQTPDYTISWVLGKMIRELPDTKVRNRVLNMPVRDLLESPPGGDLWKEIVSVLPDSTVSEFACGNSLIGRKKV